MPNLITLAAASAKYPVTKRTLRRHIAAGELAASKPGRELVIVEDDLVRLLQPTLRQAHVNTERETPRQRADRQLAAAGVR